MKNRTKYILPAAATLLPAMAHAHSGHAGIDQGLSHVVTSPDHLMAAILLVGVVVSTIAMKGLARKD
jgi:hydrogenase/urease accessory protein HupE